MGKVGEIHRFYLLSKFGTRKGRSLLSRFCKATGCPKLAIRRVEGWACFYKSSDIINSSV